MGLRYEEARFRPIFRTMNIPTNLVAISLAIPIAATAGPLRQDGDGSVKVSGELKTWHKVTLTLDGPHAHEEDGNAHPNPFTDYRLTARFTHESGEPTYEAPGYFAAMGWGADRYANNGTKWRAHLSPDKPGTWRYKLVLDRGKHVAVGGEPETVVWDKEGSFEVAPSDKTGRDFRAHGRLQYVGERYLRFAGSGRYFLKAGADAPETLLAYADFSGAEARNPGKAPLKTWKPHVRDWNPGDPTWMGGKGKGLIGALNYLAAKGCNAFSFIPYNAGGDGDNVWPFVRYGQKLNYACTRLEQWGAVFDHATAKGLFLHFKLQETENDDNRKKGAKSVPAALDGGDLGPERKLYLREMIARYSHNLGLNWNLGEENTQSPEQQRAMAAYIREIDPYDHLIVVHTYPNQQDQVYGALLGDQSVLTGASLQNSNVKDCHAQTVKWTRRSQAAGKPWVVSFDEPGSAKFGTPPDPGYPGTPRNFDDPSVATVRKQALWGTLLAGGAGVEYYFGYQLPQNDLNCEDWRSRGLTWDFSRIALDFFERERIPFWQMENADEFVGNPNHGNARYCFAKPDAVYLVYLPEGGSANLDLSAAKGDFSLGWFDPRKGGDVADARNVSGGGDVTLQAPSAGEDWLAVLRKAE